MTTRRLPFSAAFAAVALAVAGPGAAPAAADVPEYAPGGVIVRYDRGTDAGAKADVQEETGTAPADALPGGSRELEIRDGESVPETVRELRSDPRVAYAVPDYVARTSAFFPNDPGFGRPGDWRRLQWNFTGPASVNAPEAWSLAMGARAPGGRGVTVAVLDTGVAYENRGRFRRSPDLAPAGFVRGYDYVSRDPFPNDDNGHGTHIAGTVAEGTNNRRSLTGLAYGVRIMPIRVLDRRGAGRGSNIARAVRLAVDRGARVINMSFEFDSALSAAQVPDLISAFNFAQRRGVVLVAASGNEGNVAVSFPGRLPQVISVGATTVRTCQSEFSNTGVGLDVVAPGGGRDAANFDNPRDATSCRPGAPGRDIYQETLVRGLNVFGLPGGYRGTSMASPHVAAIAALIIATRRLGARPSSAAVEERIEATARDLGPEGYDVRYGAGLVDAAAALR